MKKIFLIFILIFFNIDILQSQEDNKKNNLDRTTSSDNVFGELLNSISNNDTMHALVYTDAKDDEKTNFIAIKIDPSRIFEDPDNFDYGIDMVISLYLRKKSNWEKLIRLEYFHNLNYTKFGVGIQRLFPIIKNKKGNDIIEISTGIEIGGIHRKKPIRYNESSYKKIFLSYAFNLDLRLKLGKNLHFASTINNQRRTDLNMYGDGSKKIGKFITSYFAGFGFNF